MNPLLTKIPLIEWFRRKGFIIHEGYLTKTVKPDVDLRPGAINYAWKKIRVVFLKTRLRIDSLEIRKNKPVWLRVNSCPYKMLSIDNNDILRGIGFVSYFSMRDFLTKENINEHF